MRKHLKTINELKERFVSVFVVLMIACLSFISCSDDKKEEPKNQKSIIGIWRLDFEDGYQLLTFKKNGQYSLVEIDYVSGNWSEEGTYSIEDNIITCISPDTDFGIEVYTLLALTETKLILKYEGRYVGDYHGEEIDEWYRVE